MGSNIVGFDIGDRLLKIAICDKNSVKRLFCEQIPDDMVKNGQVVSTDAMVDFLKTVRRKLHIATKDCTVILPGNSAFFRRLQIPQMSVDELKINLPYEFRDFITLDKEKYFYDYAVCGSTTAENDEASLDLMAAAAPKELIAEYSEMFRRAGFRLRGAAPCECAFSNLIAMQKDENLSKEHCFIDIGFSNTRIYIYTGVAFEVSRVIDIGYAMIVQAIADAFHIDVYIASRYLFQNHDNAQYCDNAKGIYTSIAVEILKAANFYRFNNRESLLADAYYCGDGARIVPLIETIRDTIDLELHNVAELLPSYNKDNENAILCAAAAGITRL